MKKKSSKNVDYHLDAKERASVEKLVPMHQARIHVATRACFKIDDVKFKDGAITLSEHLFVFFKKKFIGKSYSFVTQFHIFDVTSMKTHKDNVFVIMTTSHRFVILTHSAMRLARIFLRNYYIATMMMPIHYRFPFYNHDSTLFPPIELHASPSQMFQFSYNAYCSYFECSYVHEVVRIFHSQITSENGIYDLNYLPLSILEFNLGDPIHMRPLFSALMFCPYIFGVCASDICRPDLLKSVAALLISNSNMKLVSLSNCSITFGENEISNAILLNNKIKVSYWDLSYNKLEKFSPIFNAFSVYTAPVFYLDFNGCCLPEDDVLLLFKTISYNDNFHQLKYLHIASAVITERCADMFDTFLFKNNREQSLRSLDFGAIKSGQTVIFKSIAKYKPPIESLKIAGTELSESGLKELLTIIQQSEYLCELDISGSKISSHDLDLVVDTLSLNKNIIMMSLYLNSLRLCDNRLRRLFKLIDTPHQMKWQHLSLENNDIKFEDFDALIEGLRRLPNLRSLSIGRNFGHSQRIGEKLPLLLDLPSIESLCISGSDGPRCLGSELYPLINSLTTNEKIRKLDISQNRIGDEGLKKLANVLKKNKTLTEIQIDGSFPRSLTAISIFFDALIGNQQINMIKFPIEDVYRLLADAPLRQKKKYFRELSDKQLKVQISIQQTQASFGMHPFLSNKSIPELDELLDDSTIMIHKRLQEAQPHKHSAISGLLGLQLPYQREEKVPELSISQNRDVNDTNDLYETQEIGKTIEETVDDDLSGLLTLQYNSLCIRRPGVSYFDTVQQTFNMTGLPSYPPAFVTPLKQEHMPNIEAFSDSIELPPSLDVKDSSASFSEEEDKG